MTSRHESPLIDSHYPLLVSVVYAPNHTYSGSMSPNRAVGVPPPPTPSAYHTGIDSNTTAFINTPTFRNLHAACVAHCFSPLPCR